MFGLAADGNRHEDAGATDTDRYDGTKPNQQLF
jgi:hypothetical protein